MQSFSKKFLAKRRILDIFYLIRAIEYNFVAIFMIHENYVLNFAILKFLAFYCSNKFNTFIANKLVYLLIDELSRTQ